MNTSPIIKKTWMKPLVKVVSVKKDTYGNTKFGTAKEASNAPVNDRRVEP